MDEKQSYEELIVWQRAVALVPEVYRVLRGFPRAESYALCDQLRRAAVSIPANIAEGQARKHRKEFMQHLNIAKGSLAEVHTLLIIAGKLSLSEILCVRHNMTIRSMYAEQDEAEERSDCREIGGVAHHPQGTA